MKSLNCCTNIIWVCCKKDGFFGLDIDKRYLVGMCFLDGWTWHITTTCTTHIDHIANTWLFRVD